MRTAEENESPKLVSKLCILRKSKSDEKQSLGPPRIIRQTSRQTTITSHFTRRPEEEIERPKLDNFVNEEEKDQDNGKQNSKNILDINPIISIITLSINSLTVSIKDRG